MLNAQCCGLVDRVVVAGILELEGQHSVVGEVLPVDAGEGLGDDSPQTEVTWRDRRMLRRRSPLPHVGGRVDLERPAARARGATDRAERLCGLSSAAIHELACYID